MNYFITRDGQHYGPYTLADLQRYVASGEVLLTDLATSEGMTAPVPVGQIVGNIAAPAPYQPGAPVAATAFYPDPPNLHWGLVLLFVVLSCGIFSIVWEIVQASWLKKVDPFSKAFSIYMGAAALLVGVFFASFFSTLAHTPTAFTGLLQIAYYVTAIVARFSFKASMEKHFNQAEPMGLSLSGVMTFFFGGIYFQYHMNDINKRKLMDRMYAAGR
jgi:hypothetical protein